MVPAEEIARPRRVVPTVPTVAPTPAPAPSQPPRYLHHCSLRRQIHWMYRGSCIHILILFLVLWNRAMLTLKFEICDSFSRGWVWGILSISKIMLNLCLSTQTYEVWDKKMFAFAGKPHQRWWTYKAVFIYLKKHCVLWDKIKIKLFKYKCLCLLFKLYAWLLLFVWMFHS